MLLMKLQVPGNSAWELHCSNPQTNIPGAQSWLSQDLSVQGRPAKAMQQERCYRQSTYLSCQSCKSLDSFVGCAKIAKQTAKAAIRALAWDMSLT